jgi:hypothetical protein
MAPEDMQDNSAILKIGVMTVLLPVPKKVSFLIISEDKYLTVYTVSRYLSYFVVSVPIF